MFEKLADRLNARHREEEGAAMLSVIVLSMFVFLTLAAIAMNMNASTRLTALTKAEASALIAAESGADVALASALSPECEPTEESDEYGYTYALFGSAFYLQPPSDVDSYGNRRGCPQTGDRFLVVQSTGSNGRGVDTEVVSVYQWDDGSAEQAFDEAATERAMPTLISRLER